jgi:hypothetical protein
MYETAFKYLGGRPVKNQVLLKHWYAKDRRKVPESCKKNDLARGRAYFIFVLGFLLSVLPGHRD